MPTKPAVSAEERARRAAEVIGYHLKAAPPSSCHIDTEPIIQEIRAAERAAYKHGQEDLRSAAISLAEPGMEICACRCSRCRRATEDLRRALKTEE